MDIPNPTRPRSTKPSPSERFLGAYPHAPPTNPNSSTSSDFGYELTEDDIFWTNDSAAVGSNHHHHKGFPQPESFGILAALPEREASSPNGSHSHFYHKASASSSASSSPSQMIPTIPKPPPQQDHHHYRSSYSSSLKYQSAPVNISVLATAMRKKANWRPSSTRKTTTTARCCRCIRLLGGAHSPMLACSVLEGVGRTLKGRDLRRVRNAVWRRTALLFALFLANSELSYGQVLKAKVTCLDCHKNYDFSGIKVSVNCDQVKQVGMATTEADGSFEAKLPSDNSNSPAALHCLATILGGTTQLYVSRNFLVSEIVKTQDSNSYTISTPLGFFTSCPSSIEAQAACTAKKHFSSSKTVNLPLPPEWGLAPSS